MHRIRNIIAHFIMLVLGLELLQPSTAFVRTGWDHGKAAARVDLLTSSNTQVDDTESLAAKPFDQSEGRYLDACSHYATAQIHFQPFVFSSPDDHSVIQMKLSLDPFYSMPTRPPHRA